MAELTKPPEGRIIGGQTGDVTVTSLVEAAPGGESVPLMSTDRLRLVRGEMVGFKQRPCKYNAN